MYNIAKIIVILCASSLNLAQADVAGFDPVTIRDELATIQAKLDEVDNSLQASRQAVEHRKRLVLIRSGAKECIFATATKVQTLKKMLLAIGDVSQGELKDVTSSRRELEIEVSKADNERVTCALFAQTANELIEKIDRREQAELKARIFARGSSTQAVANEVLTNPREWPQVISNLLNVGSGWQALSLLQRWAIILTVLMMVATGFFLRRYCASRDRCKSGILQSLLTLSPWLLATGVSSVMLTLFLPQWPPALLTSLMLGGFIWLIFDIVIRTWLTACLSRGLAECDAKPINWWLRLIVALIIAGTILITTEAVIQLPSSYYFFLRTILVWMLLVGALWSAIILGRIPGMASIRALRVFLVLFVLTVAVAETLGFRNLSIYLLTGFSGTALGYSLFSQIARLLTFIYDGLDAGQYNWQKTIRAWLQLKSRELVPGLIWLRLATSLLVWSSFLMWVFWVWGQSDRWITVLLQYSTEGFTVGSLQIAPAQILGGIAVLAIGFSLSQWIKLKVVTDVLKRTRLDHGAKEAFITLSGYTGIIISILIALGVAGISYTNLAIIAGALSVGIGFGLQNVVNNFVSGLILLFERPVRTGDWIVVGDTQGYVRKISIRSTQIETFDRADVIVPNSELISNKVSNLTLRDPWGRITLPVSVAYGSDIETVIRVLLNVTLNHPLILKDRSEVSDPKVLFMRFGDSALEFELRCFIKQIDKRLDVIHQLNVAIDRDFREAGIAIPFPQRDIHVIGENSKD